MCHIPFKMAALSLITTLVILTAVTKPVSAVTWSVNITRFTTYSTSDVAPAITETSDGRIWIAWARDILGNLTLFYSTSSDLGNTWTTEQNLTKELGPGQNTSPSIFQAENGTIWVVWSSNKPPPPPPPEPDFTIDASPLNLTIEKEHSGNSTIIITSLLNLSEPVTLSSKKITLGVSTTFNPNPVTPPPNGTANSTLTISVDNTATPGNYTLAVVGKSENKSHSVQVFLEITEVGGTASSNTAEFLSSILQQTSWYDYEIFYKTSHDNGMTWSRDMQLTDNTRKDGSPAIVQLNNGTILVVWESQSEGNTDIYYKTTLDGKTWSDTRQLTTDPEFDGNPSVLQASDGKIWTTWVSNRTGDLEIFYTIYDGVSWSAAARLVERSSYLDSSPSLYQTVNGTFWLFWVSGTGESNISDIYYKYSYNGTLWSDPVPFTDTTDDYTETSPCVYQTRDTRMWVVWTSNRAIEPDGNPEIYYRTSLPGDINEDGVVDTLDMSIISMSFGYEVGDPEYNPDADLNKDGVVDILDVSIVAFYFGQT